MLQSATGRCAVAMCLAACGALVLWKQFKVQRSLVAVMDVTAKEKTSALVLQEASGGASNNNYVLVEPPLRLNGTYIPASSEAYVVTHAQELGFLAESLADLKEPSCKIFLDPQIPVYDSLQIYRKELAEYTRRVEAFSTVIQDLRISLRQGRNRQELCSTLDLNISSIFSKSQQLSYGSFGYAEPLIPPLRHPEFCFGRYRHLMTMTYMIHDWTAMCQRLTPFSRTVFIDMGASLAFHAHQGITPAVYILETYKKFGFSFDHIYAFEVTEQKPTKVFEMVPSELLSKYHWINVGVEADPNGKMNPLRMLLEQFTEEDFVVVKLDIDTGSIEVPLAYQLLNDERYSKLVDQLYFEHHVFQLELAPSWQKSMQGSLKSSLDLFGGLRRKGIASHYWV